MSPRILLRPTDDRTVALFGHWGEALVFWASVAGLLLLAVIAVIRLADGRTAGREVRELQVRLTTLEAKADSLAHLGQDQTRQIAELQRQLAATQTELQSRLPE